MPYERILVPTDLSQQSRRAFGWAASLARLLGAEVIGLYVPPLVWREIHNFSTNSVCLVLASQFYDISDYLDVYADFRKAVGAPRM